MCWEWSYRNGGGSTVATEPFGRVKRILSASNAHRVPFRVPVIVPDAWASGASGRGQTDGHGMQFRSRGLSRWSGRLVFDRNYASYVHRKRKREYRVR